MRVKTLCKIYFEKIIFSIHITVFYTISDLECPSCREKHSVSLENIKKFPKNLALENIVFRYQEILSNRLSRAVKLDNSNDADDLSKRLSPSSFRDQESFEDEISKFLCGLLKLYLKKID